MPFAVHLAPARTWRRSRPAWWPSRRTCTRRSSSR
ncbi:hypothetical protein HMPREF1315_2501, partial [Bifidobacterium longum subsp. longum 2-2B]